MTTPNTNTSENSVTLTIGSKIKLTVEIPSVWKTIQLGAGPKNILELYVAMGGVRRVDDLAFKMLNTPAFKTSPEICEVDLVRMKLWEMGLTEGAARPAIYARAIALGLRLCPSEVGPQLEIQNPGRWGESYLHVGMKPISFLYERLCSDVRDFIFFMHSEGLHGSTSGYYDYVYPDKEFIFVKPRKHETAV